jgi:hypothetical protein
MGLVWFGFGFQIFCFLLRALGNASVVVSGLSVPVFLNLRITSHLSFFPLPFTSLKNSS